MSAAHIPATLPASATLTCSRHGCSATLTLTAQDALPAGWRVREGRSNAAGANWAGRGGVSLTRPAVYTCPACVAREAHP